MTKGQSARPPCRALSCTRRRVDTFRDCVFDGIVIVSPPAEPFEDSSRGRIDVGAKFAPAFLTSLQNVVGKNVEYV